MDCYQQLLQQSIAASKTRQATYAKNIILRRQCKYWGIRLVVCFLAAGSLLSVYHLYVGKRLVQMEVNDTKPVTVKPAALQVHEQLVIYQQHDPSVDAMNLKLSLEIRQLNVGADQTNLNLEK